MKNKIQILEKQIAECNQCSEKSNNSILFGRSLSERLTDNIDVLFLGMAPKPETYDNRIERIIFGPYSPTGKKIARIIEEFNSFAPNMACWGTNCVKCNIVEEGILDAMAKCRKYLIDEIKMLNPKRIILLGKNVTERFLGDKFIAGQITIWENIPCLHYYHPMERTGRFGKNKELLFEFLGFNKK